MARPSKFKPEFQEQAELLCALGATDVQMAAFFKVTESTFQLWKIKHPEFSESLKLSKEAEDNKVEKSLFQRAMGYSHEDVDIRTVAVGDGMSQIVQTPIVKHYPPDPTSMIFWLKNRRKEVWRDRHENTLVNPDGSNIMQQVAIELAKIDAGRKP